MIKIVDQNVVDIVPCTGGILFARKQAMSEERWKISFYALDMSKMKIKAIMRGQFLRVKFGEGYRRISHEIEDYISCNVDTFLKNYTVLVYPTGETGLFDSTGKAVWAGDLLYHASPVTAVAADGKQLWCTVPEENAIISYSMQHKKFYMRIGSKSSLTFLNPVDIQKYGNELFVSCADACKIRSVNLKNYAVTDFRTFDEPVYKYMRVCGKELVHLASGVYIL